MSNTLSHDLVVTRKPHRCWGCVEMFAKGTKMWRCVGKDNGVLFSTYACEPCQAEMDAACDRDPYLADDGLQEGCVLEWRREEKMAEARLERARVLPAEQAIAQGEKVGGGA